MLFIANGMTSMYITSDFHQERHAPDCIKWRGCRCLWAAEMAIEGHPGSRPPDETLPESI